MILGLGTDLVDIRRISDCYARFGTRFVSRILSPREQSAFTQRMNAPEIYLASRFAAKEAVAKALGQGFRGGISMRDIMILTNELGQPYIECEGAVLSLMNEKKVSSTFLSITHERHYAMAVVVLESFAKNTA